MGEVDTVLTKIDVGWTSTPEPEPPTPQPYVITAYTAGPESTGKRPGDKAFGVTASGERVKAGRSASCPRELPLGTVISIEGVGERVCVDRGGRIVGNIIDLYVPTVKEAVEFGKQTLGVTILNEKETIE